MKLTPIEFRPAAGAVVIALCSCAATPDATSPPAAGERTAETREARGSAVETLHFEVKIAAPVERVWDTMLGAEGYTKWTVPFSAGSYFEGSWSQGERIRFLAPGGSGMVAEIAVHRPHELVSIKHIGHVHGGVEDTTSDAVRSWAPAYENYRFAAVPGGTVVTVEQDVTAEFEDYMRETWPKALDALRSLCESAARGTRRP